MNLALSHLPEHWLWPLWIFAVLVIYRPHWIATFDDARYLNR